MHEDDFGGEALPERENVQDMTKYKIFITVHLDFEELLEEELYEILSSYSTLVNRTMESKDRGNNVTMKGSNSLEGNQIINEAYLTERSMNKNGIMGFSEFKRRYKVKRDEGGIELLVSREELWRLMHQCRLAENIRVRLISKPQHAAYFSQLQKIIDRLPLAAYLTSRGRKLDHQILPQKIHVKCRKSKLYHSGAVQERVEDALMKRMERIDNVKSSQRHINTSLQSMNPDLYLRIVNDYAEFSVDASGPMLYKRGYRTHISEAPLRETIAAGLLRLAMKHSNWNQVNTNQVNTVSSKDNDSNLARRERLLNQFTPLSVSDQSNYILWDPFCGSGTFVIEAACMASQKLTSCAYDEKDDMEKRFAFENWPSHDEEMYRNFLQSLKKDQQIIQRECEKRQTCPKFFGSDISAKAISSSKHNAMRAGFSKEEVDCMFIQGHFENVEPQIFPKDFTGNSILIANLPYGKRITKDNKKLKDMYSQFGSLLKKCESTLQNVFVITPGKSVQLFEKATRRKWEPLLSFRNGGIAVRFLKMLK